MMTGILGVKEVSLVSQATPLEGVASIALLLGIAVLVLYVLWCYLKWQEARQ
jgi:hypothetical protein